jgi:hypothetical protein
MTAGYRRAGSVLVRPMTATEPVKDEALARDPLCMSVSDVGGLIQATVGGLGPRPWPKPDWLADYRATRPKVERKLAHLIRRGRRASHRGLQRVDADRSLLAGAVNLARLATLGLQHDTGSWQITPA